MRKNKSACQSEGKAKSKAPREGGRGTGEARGPVRLQRGRWGPDHHKGASGLREVSLLVMEIDQEVLSRKGHEL